MLTDTASPRPPDPPSGEGQARRAAPCRDEPAIALVNDAPAALFALRRSRPTPIVFLPSHPATDLDRTGGLELDAPGMERV